MKCSFCCGPSEQTGPLVGAQQTLLDGFVMQMGICRACVDSALTCVDEAKAQDARNKRAERPPAEDGESQELMLCSFCEKNHKQVAQMITGGRMYRHEYEPGKMNYYTFAQPLELQIQSIDKKLDFMGHLFICNECATLARDILQDTARPL